MPNTLAHIGIQSLLTRKLIPHADFKWIFLACVIPDFSWIYLRLVNQFFTNLNPYDVLLFGIVQASFVFTLLLSLALASLSRSFWKVFAILSFNTFFHLVLDACQIKWGNGVHLFAPFNWVQLNWGWFWPESLWSYALTLFGFLYFFWSLREPVENKSTLIFNFKRIVGFVFFISLYFTLPLLCLEAVENADCYSVQTLRHVEDRLGKSVAYDRKSYSVQSDGGVIDSVGGEKIRLENMPENVGRNISIKGEFVTNHKIRVLQCRSHNPEFRDGASYLGLLLVLLLWMVRMRREVQKGFYKS